MNKRFEQTPYQKKKNDIRMLNKHMKRSSASFVIREMQVKTTAKYHYILIGMAK